MYNHTQFEKCEPNVVHWNRLKLNVKATILAEDDWIMTIESGRTERKKADEKLASLLLNTKGIYYTASAFLKRRFLFGKIREIYRGK